MRTRFFASLALLLFGSLGLGQGRAWGGQPAPVITSSTSASGTVGTAFSYTITASNSPTSFDAAPLPAGLTVNTVTGVISGTPTDAATTNTTISATNSTGTGSATLTITIAASGGGGGSGSPGSFRFLTSATSLPGTDTTAPKASTNLVYDATLLTANAAGPVTYSISSGRLPTGLTLDANTGFITGRPTVVETTNVTFSANDTATTITLSTSIKVSATGGGGNAGINFPFDFAFPDGKVGQPYTITITAENGVGPFFFGMVDLPPGVTLSGLEDRDRTVTLSGIPSAPGTFYVTMSVTDQGEGNNKVVVIEPFKVLPATSDFQFTTFILDNGEIGTAFNDTIKTNLTTGVTIGASGLPPGLSIDSTTGVISGTPTAAGTFLVILNATNGIDTLTMNRPMIIVAAGSSFHWVFSGGLPTGTLNVEYGRTNPPLVLATANPPPGVGSVTYAAAGLPEGITYNATTGEFLGIPTEIGIFPVTFSATDSTSNTVISFTYDMIVLPPNGGDVNSLPINLWVKKGQVKVGTDGKESWQMQYIYNANRTAPKIFDTTKDALIIKLGGIPELNITPPTNVLTGKRPKFSFKTAKGVIPARALKLDMSAQTIALTGKSETIPDAVPSVMTNRVTLGRKGYKLDLLFDEKGKFTPTAGLRKTAFVVDKAKVTVKAAGKDAAAWAMFLGDPSFVFPAANGNKTVKFKVINSKNQDVMVKDFTAIVTFTTKTDAKSGLTFFKFKSGKDATPPLGKFAYDSKSGKLGVALKGLTLTGLLSAAEEHVFVEVDIADKQYFTGVTIFAPKAGSYSTKMP